MPQSQNYNRYQYETSPRKLQPKQKPAKKHPKAKRSSIAKVKKTKKELQKERKQLKKQRAKTVFYLVLGFGILFTMGYRNSAINESFAKKQSLEKEIAALKKENEQLEVSIQNILNLNQLEYEAQSRLGMQKLTNKQTVYINLPKKDYMEAGTEKIIIIEEKGNLFENILNKFMNILK